MNPAATALRLYVSDECELCDRAIAVLAQARVPDFECIGIEGNAALQQRYGVRVPVLHDVSSDRELGWPFDADGVVRFLDALSNAT
ncbi:glutaredoxin family protein [Dokdonella sp.]|uniref:glutaredoxin family protein n=1 Tax=Dokdonella sp. TaxID=2291710 RepID=UPI003C417392